MTALAHERLRVWQIGLTGTERGLKLTIVSSVYSCKRRVSKDECVDGERINSQENATIYEVAAGRNGSKMT